MNYDGDAFRDLEEAIFLNHIAHISEALRKPPIKEPQESVPDRGTVIAGSRQILADLREMAA